MAYRCVVLGVPRMFGGLPKIRTSPRKNGNSIVRTWGYSVKPHIFFRKGRWQLREVRQMWLFGDEGRYYRLARPAQKWCDDQNRKEVF